MNIVSHSIVVVYATNPRQRVQEHTAPPELTRQRTQLPQNQLDSAGDFKKKKKKTTISNNSSPNTRERQREETQAASFRSLFGIFSKYQKNPPFFLWKMPCALVAVFFILQRFCFIFSSHFFFFFPTRTQFQLARHCTRMPSDTSKKENHVPKKGTHERVLYFRSLFFFSFAFFLFGPAV